MHYNSKMQCLSISAELQAKHEHKVQSLRDELELRRKTEIHEIEEVGHVVCVCTTNLVLQVWTVAGVDTHL